jgi:hypothetical protein
MPLPAPQSVLQFSLRLTKRTDFAAVAGNGKAITSQLLAVSLIYALCLQCVLLPQVAIAALSSNVRITAADKQIAENEATKEVTSEVISEARSDVINNGALVNAFSQMPAGDDTVLATITDAVVSKHKPTLNSGRIEGTLRVLLGESFTINGNNQITSDLYLPGTPAIQLNGAARCAGTVSDGGVTTPANYTVSLSGDVDLPGRIHTNVDPINLPADFASSVPAAGGTRTVSLRQITNTTRSYYLRGMTQPLIGTWPCVSNAIPTLELGLSGTQRSFSSLQ